MEKTAPLLLLSCLVIGTSETSALAQAPGSESSQAPNGTPDQSSAREYSVALVVTPANECAERYAADDTGVLCEKPRHSGRFELGAGYQPDEKFVASAAVAQDRLFGSKHSLKLKALVSQRRQEFTLNYDVPRLFDSDRDLKMELHNNRLAYRDFALQRVGGSFQVSRPLGSGLGVYAGYRLEQLSTDVLGPQAAALATMEPAGPIVTGETGIVAGLRAGVTYDNQETRDRRTQANFFVERSSPWMGSDYDLVRAGAKVSHRKPIVGPFGLHLQGGVESVMARPGTAVPVGERLHFEGNRDVRGFQLGSVGFDYGSGFKATGSAELEFALVPSWGISGAVFYDAGIFGSGSASQLAHSAGASLIFDSPIGPLRLDLAYPLDGVGSPSLLLGIGSPF